MRKSVCVLTIIMVASSCISIYGAEYTSSYATINIDGVPDEQFYIDAFKELSEGISVINDFTDDGYAGTPLDDNGDIIYGWAYCPAELIENVTWYGGRTYSEELLEADSYLLFNEEMVAEVQCETNPYSAPTDFGYVSFKIMTDAPGQVKAWMYSDIVICDTERDITYNYSVDIFGGSASEQILLPSGVYSAYLSTSYVDYEFSSTAYFVVDSGRIARCQLVNSGASLNESGIELYESDVLEETYEWVDVTEADNEVYEEVEVVYHYEDEVLETDEETADVSDNEPETNHDSGENNGGADSNSGINLSGAEIFNMLSAGLLIFTIYWYFYRKKRKQRGLRF